MNMLHRMIVRLFLPVLGLALLFFVLILQLVDFFGNLWGYLSNDAPYRVIALAALYYLPKCVSYALPISLLFAVSFTLGSLYANNELIAVLGSGVSLAQLVAPIVALGLLATVGMFFFQEDIVISTFRMKNELTQQMLQRKTSYSNTNVTVLSEGGRTIYHAQFFNDTNQTLSNLTVLERDDAGDFVERIDAQYASWTNGRWELHGVRRFTWNEQKSFLIEQDLPVYTESAFTESPDTFRRSVRNVDEMTIQQAKEWIASLKKAGLPYRADLTDYYNRFAFAFTCFIVTFISSAVGGRFKKNILLMSLLLSLVISVVFYVAQMVMILLAKLGFISPILGAWGAVVLFSLSGVYLFRIART